MGKRQVVTIKGTKDGLSLYLDDTCSFEQIVKELNEKLTTEHVSENQPFITVHVKLGNRYLHKDQEEQLKEIVRKKKKLVIHSIESNVLTKEEALEWKKSIEVTTITKVVRSGQVMKVDGDLLLLGDVNPGGTIIATGNIYVMGSLRGIAHAGSEGNQEAIIAASYMEPSQLRIADYISRSPDYESEGVYMECGFIDHHQNKIVIDRLQTVIQKRPNFDWEERGISNG